MDASIYVQNDNLANTNLIFIGTCLTNTLTASPEPHSGVSYTSVAFIKTFDGNFNLLQSVSSGGLTAGQPFAINLNTAGATHVRSMALKPRARSQPDGVCQFGQRGAGRSYSVITGTNAHQCRADANPPAKCGAVHV